MVLNATTAGAADFGPRRRSVAPLAPRRSIASFALLASAAVHAAAFVAFGPLAAIGSRPADVLPAGPRILQVAIAPTPPVPSDDPAAVRSVPVRPARPAPPRAQSAPGTAPREHVEGVATVPPEPLSPAPAGGIGQVLASGPPVLAPARVGPRASAPVPIVPAAYLRTPAPDYPQAAREEGEEGVVMLSVRISTRGLPAEIVLEQSSGHGALDRAALAGVRRWTFTPARRGDEPIEAWMRIPIRFRLG